ncbi:guanyl-nucleotide exchange factor Sec73 [Schizosaccharomyces cryophilus OY26]|uniref:Guanyl-nucleotide exchange factor Sec73 n=1 Tax=Schizosaccharomyces cryophilus (strain OY26 / ATCC MYA-4695 / CBS 11777 / NBRC 106824 / NRRL Y48691) TaxID=653667 RepID=S9XFH7_SCHCR|nr:guanyl-nucleotide exchange factor Sec73 [Schizosaccharomyces cryophilus OY26]EPY52366.1 guanyl-nucleotide exchange factor Sec73 [Schizosaccharomyces cryophilus OY26]
MTVRFSFGRNSLDSSVRNKEQKAESKTKNLSLSRSSSIRTSDSDHRVNSQKNRSGRLRKPKKNRTETPVASPPDTNSTSFLKKKGIFHPKSRAKHSFYLNQDSSSENTQESLSQELPLDHRESGNVSPSKNREPAFPRSASDVASISPVAKSPLNGYFRPRSSRSFFRLPRFSRRSWNDDQPIEHSSHSLGELSFIQKQEEPKINKSQDISVNDAEYLTPPFHDSVSSNKETIDHENPPVLSKVVRRPTTERSLSSNCLERDIAKSPLDFDTKGVQDDSSSSVHSISLSKTPPEGRSPVSSPESQKRNPRARPRSSTIPSQRTIEKLRENRSSLFNFRSLKRDGYESFAHVLEHSNLFSDLKPNPNKFLSSVPKLEDSDTAESYLNKLRATVPYSCMIPVLAERENKVLSEALHLCMCGMDFSCRPLDFCLRLFLLKSHLPKETQQIDRVITAFSKRYYECNTEMFSSQDQCYILVFSLIMLHTDAFNVNNKHKMTKQEFINICQIDDLTPEIFEYYYDNITYTPFVNLDDELFLLEKEKTEKFYIPSRKRLGLSPYTFTLESQLSILRNDVPISFNNKYVTPGMEDSRSLAGIQKRISKSSILQLVSHRSHPMAFSNHFIGLPDNSDPGLVDFNISMLGILPRSERKRRVSGHSSFKEHLILLTSSRMLFFRNSAWARDLVSQQEAYEREVSKTKSFNNITLTSNTTTSTMNDYNHRTDLSPDSNSFDEPALVFSPPIEQLSPETTHSLVNAFAYCDRECTDNSPHVFYVLFRDGCVESLSAPTMECMMEWISRINYIATLRTAGLQMPYSDSYLPRRDFSCYPKDMEQELAAVEVQLEQDLEIARKRTIGTRIDQLNKDYEQLSKELSILHKNVKNLSVCAPLQPKTRAVILQAYKKLESKIQSVYLDMKKIETQLKILEFEFQVDQSPNHIKSVKNQCSSKHDCHITETGAKDTVTDEEGSFVSIVSSSPTPSDTKEFEWDDKYGNEDSNKEGGKINERSTPEDLKLSSKTNSPKKLNALKLQISNHQNDLDDTASLGSVTTCFDYWQPFEENEVFSPYPSPTRQETLHHDLEESFYDPMTDLSRWNSGASHERGT